MVHSFNPGTREAEAGDFCEFQASAVCIVRSEFQDSQDYVSQKQNNQKRTGLSCFHCSYFLSGGGWGWGETGGLSTAQCAWGCGVRRELAKARVRSFLDC